MNTNIKRIINGSIIGGALGCFIQLVTGGVRFTFKGAVILPSMTVLISVGVFMGVVYVLSGIISD